MITLLYTLCAFRSIKEWLVVLEKLDNCINVPHEGTGLCVKDSPDYTDKAWGGRPDVEGAHNYMRVE